jgi:REP element-mobilizing transposase RayT
MKFDSEKHHRRSIRLKGYDYSQPGYYSVTICSRNRQCIFADTINDVGVGLAPAQINVTIAPIKNDLFNKDKTIFQLTEIGYIINENWRKILNLYKNINIDEFVIMPNHLHGIIIISRYYKRATARVAPTLGQIIGSFKS